MSQFCYFSVEGVKYKRNKEGKKIGIEFRARGSGITRDDRTLLGSIYRQCPQLLHCDTITRLDTYPI